MVFREHRLKNRKKEPVATGVLFDSIGVAFPISNMIYQ